jgi:hypothetical protein
LLLVAVEVLRSQVVCIRTVPVGPDLMRLRIHLHQVQLALEVPREEHWVAEARRTVLGAVVVVVVSLETVLIP